MPTHTIAAFQVYHGPDSTPAGNRDRIVAHLRDAAAAGARLALFPELSLSGYTVDERDIPLRAAATTPAIIASIVDEVRRLGVAAVVGVLEPAPAPRIGAAPAPRIGAAPAPRIGAAPAPRVGAAPAPRTGAAPAPRTGAAPAPRVGAAPAPRVGAEPAPDKAYNASLAIAADGTITRYRKIHVCPNEPYQPSSGGPVVADLGFLRLGLSVCYDNWFPETTRMAFLGGAQMLHSPFWWPAEWERSDDLARKRVAGDDDAVLAARRERMMKVFPGRALDNSLYLVLIDHGGRSANVSNHMPGKSMVIDPYGELLAETEGWQEEAIYFEFDPERVAEWRHNRFFPGHELRPSIYCRAYEAWQARREA